MASDRKFWWDGMNELQVRERADLTTDELIAAWDDHEREALRARTDCRVLIADCRS